MMDSLSFMTASYTVSIRQASDLLSASFRFPVARNTLAAQLMVPLTGPIEDFHLLVKKNCAMPGAPIKKALYRDRAF